MYIVGNQTKYIKYMYATLLSGKGKTWLTVKATVNTDLTVCRSLKDSLWSAMMIWNTEDDIITIYT